jgi:hypothetical protein
MKVGKVIEYLQTLDPELDVFIHDINLDEVYQIANIRPVEGEVRFQFTEDEAS